MDKILTIILLSGLGLFVLVFLIMLFAGLARKNKLKRLTKKNGKIIELFIRGSAYAPELISSEYVEFHTKVGESLFSEELTDDFGNKRVVSYTCNKIDVEYAGTKNHYCVTFNDCIQRIGVGLNRTVPSTNIEAIKLSLRFENGFVYIKEINYKV